MSKVIVRNCSDYNEKDLKKIIGEILDESRVTLNKKRVFIKPNMLGVFRPERAVTTHPSIVKVLIEEVKKRGAKEIKVGDNPGVGGYAMIKKIAKVTKIGNAAGDYFVNVGLEGVKFNLNGDKFLVSKEILSSDVLINVPKFKTHSLTVITGGIKNMFGIIIGAGKANLHRAYPQVNDFASLMADVCAIRKPDLTIIDGIYGMEGNGPSAGKIRKIGKIIASSDVVSADAVMSKMMGLTPNTLPMLKRAQELKLGTFENPEVKGAFEVFKKFSLPITSRISGSLIGRFVNTVGFYFVTRRYPALVEEKCTSCKICFEGCPAGAITMDGKYPVINYSECITCFCCHEQCPTSAWKMKVKLFT